MKFYQKWTGEVCDNDGKTHTFPVNVPGNIQKDFYDYMGYPDIMAGNNAAVLEKTEGYTWIYRTKPEFSLIDGENVFFVSEGIDYIFDIILDGEVLYSSEGMYTPVRVDLTNKIKKDSELSVKIHPHPKNGDIVRDRAEATDTCKPPVSYGWDWNPRLLVSGMWQDAYIETVNNGTIKSCELYYDLDTEEKNARVRVNTDCCEIPHITLYNRDGDTVYSGTDSEFTLSDINLWWCSGLGEPYLYRWTAETSTDKKEGYIGFRTIRLLQNEGCEHGPEGGFPKGQYYAPITVELNGVRVFAKGSNVVNPGLFPGNVGKEEYEYIVSSLKEANMNIVRIWGGCGIFKPKFYDLCDRYGIMVWQEFMLACNLYSDDEKYLKILKKEATSIVRCLRCHPSLIFYCGGNELFNDWSGMTEQSHPLRLLNSVCFEEDRNRPFIYTSPVSGMAHGGYVFRDDDGNEIFNRFINSEKTAYTEFGCPSIADRDILERIIPDNEINTLAPTDSWKVHHAFGSWGEKRWACPDVIEHYFGKQKSIDGYISASQRLQCFGYKLCFEEARRQWGHCSMALNWCFNEPWLCAANNSLISYPDRKKPAFEAVKTALKPISASARIPKYSYMAGEKLEFEVWYHNETLSKVCDKVTVKVILNDDVIYASAWETGEIAPMSNRKGLAVSFTLPDNYQKQFLKIVLETENPEAANDYEILFDSWVSYGRMMNV